MKAKRPSGQEADEPGYERRRPAEEPADGLVARVLVAVVAAVQVVGGDYRPVAVDAAPALVLLGEPPPGLPPLDAFQVALEVFLEQRVRGTHLAMQLAAFQHVVRALEAEPEPVLRETPEHLAVLAPLRMPGPAPGMHLLAAFAYHVSNLAVVLLCKRNAQRGRVFVRPVDLTGTTVDTAAADQSSVHKIGLAAKCNGGTGRRARHR